MRKLFAIAILVLVASACTPTEASTHCTSAANERYKYVPGGVPDSWKSNYAQKCEDGDRELFSK